MEGRDDQPTADVESGARLRPSAVRSRGAVTWPSVDGPLGVSWEEAETSARRFFFWGFAFLPLLWAVNCFYFWPVLVSKASPSSSPHFNRIRSYVVWSSIGFVIFAVLLTAWALTFAIGGEHLFGPMWKDLVMYNLADKLQLTGLM
ncbi:Gamma-secretase subunit pen-2 [Rhynchospora pubera]|uniref:Gamma-secretase subunit pen-2 n=1 Tax=Rhynchospora pubera TaxID=906938 RepID=A0AAV8CQP8_9POAL|nr:Gamma-secretase subunit pen-2 [Rhynchospora pubera]KAJ4757531.1 Gamma-secretase subunit pen-2 [Rhynchospora pubera]KAJ4810025.1 Gamma-secretase subunit pen-2 [Rhynchospora pubera]